MIKLRWFDKAVLLVLGFFLFVRAPWIFIPFAIVCYMLRVMVRQSQEKEKKRKKKARKLARKAQRLRETGQGSTPSSVESTA